LSTQSFTVADPRTFDGDPYEVAERAVRQAEAVSRVLLQVLHGARIMARNAQLERELHETGECDAVAYDESAQGRAFAAIKADIEESQRRLGVLAKAAGYNPKTPLSG